MNKKFFAALASATMAFSATGSLAVFADEFDTVDEYQSVPGTGDVLSEVNLYDVMDRNLVTAVVDAYATAVPGKTLDPEHARRTELNKITVLDSDTLSSAAQTALLAVKDFKGIEYLTKLQTLNIGVNTNNGPASATTVDLSNNNELKVVAIRSAYLADLELPEENTLRSLSIVGTPIKYAPIHSIDFRGFTKDSTEDVSINVAYTGLVKADLTGVATLDTATFTYNPMYNVNVNGLNDLGSLTVAHTYLKSLDVTTNKNLTTLILNDNHLDTIDLSKSWKVANLNIDNNYFGAIDLTGTKVSSWAADSDGNPATAVQTLYTSVAYDTVDLTQLKDFHVQSVGSVAGLTPENDGNGDPTGVYSLDGTSFSYKYDGRGTYTPTNPLLAVKIDNNAELMNRLYNPNSGEHFYTKDTNEKDVLTGLGWTNEGIGWVAPLNNGTSEPVYRLYNPNAGDHHYTKNVNEMNVLVSHGWKNEGIGWYSVKDDTQGVKYLPLFREYNPNATGAGSHNYTTDVEENDFLVSIGWNAEGFAWNALK